MSNFFGSSNGFLPPRKRSSGLNGPVQNVVATTAAQPPNARPATFGPPPAPSVSEQVAFQRSQLAKGASGDHYGQKDMVTVQSYAPPPSTPAITRPPMLPNENPLIRQFANQNAQTPEEQIQKVLARDAGLAIPADKLAKVIPISRGLMGLGRLGNLGALTPDQMVLPEVAAYRYEQANRYAYAVKSFLTGASAKPATATAAWAAGIISAPKNAIDFSFSDAVAAVAEAERLLAPGVAAIDAAAADALWARISAGIEATKKLRDAQAAEVAAAGFSVTSPPNYANVVTLAEAAGAALTNMVGFLTQPRPLLAGIVTLRNTRVPLLAKQILAALDQSDPNILAVLDKFVALAMDDTKATPQADADALKTQLQTAINARSQVLRQKLSASAAVVSAASFDEQARKLLLSTLTSMNAQRFGDIVIALTQKTDGIVRDASNVVYKISSAAIQSAATEINNELVKRQKAFLESIGQVSDENLALAVTVLDTGKGMLDKGLTPSGLFPFADIIRGESARRAEIKRIAAEAAAAEAAQKKAEADAAARKAAEEQTRQAAEEAARKKAEADAAEAEAIRKAAEAAVAKAQPKGSSTTMILLAVGAVLGVAYLVSKKQQTLGAAPLLLEELA